MSTPTILSPVDFSDASRGALRYAAVLAEHFGGQLVILTVEDPLLTEAISLATGAEWNPEHTRQETARFAASVLGDGRPEGVRVEFEVAVGKPANEILKVAQQRSCDLIVMSSHGLTGVRKLFFGSTTERVLRETTVPVLVTPPSDPGPDQFDEVGRTVGRILVPVDLSSAALRQVRIARALSEALHVPFIVTHVVEPVRSPLAARLHLPGIEQERRTRAENALRELLANAAPHLQPEALVVYGDPAEEVAKVARDRRAGLIVLGLHGSPVIGARMGSVTYRVLCLAPALVLAVPPLPVPKEEEWLEWSARRAPVDTRAANEP